MPVSGGGEEVRYRPKIRPAEAAAAGHPPGPDADPAGETSQRMVRTAMFRAYLLDGIPEDELPYYDIPEVLLDEFLELCEKAAEVSYFLDEALELCEKGVR